MWPLWLELLVGWSGAPRCLFVDQVEEGRALVTDGDRLAAVEDNQVAEGDRLCFPSLAAQPSVAPSSPAAPIRYPLAPVWWRLTDTGDAHVR